MRNWKASFFNSLPCSLVPQWSTSSLLFPVSNTLAKQEWMCCLQVWSSDISVLRLYTGNLRRYILGKRGIWWCLILNAYKTSLWHWSFILPCCLVTVLCSQTLNPLDTWFEAPEQILTVQELHIWVWKELKRVEREVVWWPNTGHFSPWAWGSVGAGWRKDTALGMESWSLCD